MLSVPNGTGNSVLYIIASNKELGEFFSKQKFSLGHISNHIKKYHNEQAKFFESRD